MQVPPVFPETDVASAQQGLIGIVKKGYRGKDSEIAGTLKLVHHIGIVGIPVFLLAYQEGHLQICPQLVPGEEGIIPLG